MPGDVNSLSSADGKEATMPRKECDCPHRTVGARVSGNGTNDTKQETKGDEIILHNREWEMLVEKVKVVQKRMEKIRLKNHEAAMSLELCFMPSIRHGLPIDTLTRQEMCDVDKELYQNYETQHGDTGCKE